MRKRIKNTFYSFPFQLLVLHLRSNLVLFAIWVILGLFVTGTLGLKLGIRYLFMSPEYLGKVGYWSFFYLGVGFGAFMMSWNLTTYLLEAKYFPFLASLARPFTKFCINNFVLPFAFILLFLGNLIHFGLHHEFLSSQTVLNQVLGFFSGIFALVLLIAAYFNFTNKDILSYVKKDKKLPPNLEKMVPGARGLPDFADIKANKNQWRVDTYLTESIRVRLVRSVAHYDSKTLFRVFKQNHTNALIVQLLSLIILVLLGIMIERPSFRIPTGSSIFLLSSVVVAITGAISYWFERWRILVLMGIILFINQATKYDLFHHDNQAYGLDYQTSAAPYSYEALEEICSPENITNDQANTIQILNNWKKKVDHQKPKMVFYCVSGGGLKATTWAMRVLQYTDSLTQGDFLKHTVLMSGASGGMIGAAYYRELYLRQQNNQIENIYDKTLIDNVSKDLLNPVSFTIVTNDLFLPWATFEKNNYTYKKDRGYIFEKQLNENTHSFFDKSLADYEGAEKEALIPLFFLTPSIVNDGRRMIISSQGVSYMMAAPIGLQMPHSVDIDAVDFGRIFEQQESQNLSLTTAIRMNATYPYILPNVTLPSKPIIEVMDAGFRDNFGLKSATRFIHVFKDWILENTSGVVLVVVRAYDRDKEIQSNENEGLFESLVNPLGIAGKIMMLQNYEHDTNLGFLYDLLGEDYIDIVRFTYHPSENLKDAPISFHITKRQKRDVLKAVYSEENQTSLKRIENLLSKETNLKNAPPKPVQ